LHRNYRIFTFSGQGLETHLLTSNLASELMQPTLPLKEFSAASISAKGRIETPPWIIWTRSRPLSIYILKEALARLKKLALLWSLDGTKIPKRSGRTRDHETEDAFERLRVGMPACGIDNHDQPPTARELAIDISRRSVAEATEELSTCSPTPECCSSNQLILLPIFKPGIGLDGRKKARRKHFSGGLF
jgi:hypothetical protein